MPNDKQAPRELKVTDKRIFTPDGDIRDEFKTEIRPVAAAASAPGSAAESSSREREQATSASTSDSNRQPREDRRGAEPRSAAEKGTNPGTPFTNFVETLILQAYMSLGMLRNPYQPEPQSRVDVAAARQMIDLLTMLREKTAGNLTAEESAFLQDHLGELKLAFVQRTKSIE